MNKEIRTFTLQDIEVREAVDGAAPEIRGYAAVFGAESLDLGGFQEVIERGAFSRTLAASPDVRAVVEHTGGLTTIGRTRNGTLELREDETGLAVRIVPPPTSAGRDAYALVQRGDMDQMSFAFWDGRKTGGTYGTVQYADKQGKLWALLGLPKQGNIAIGG